MGGSGSINNRGLGKGLRDPAEPLAADGFWRGSCVSTEKPLGLNGQF